MHYLVLGITLYLFWVILSGHYSGLLLGLGALSMFLVVWVIRRMDRVDGEPRSIRPTPQLLAFGIWLLYCVIRSNLDVVSRIWSPDLPIRPAWHRLGIRLRSSMHKTLYANSITLTPGTLTTEVSEDHFMVHCLTEEGMKELEDGQMEDRIRRLRM